MAARVHGRVTQWFDDRGYGFITASGGSKQIFLHVSAITSRGVRPKIGDTVTFLTERDDQGRLRALAVHFDGDAGGAAPRAAVPWLAALSVIATIAALAAAGHLPWWMPVLYAGASGIKWSLYGWDKARAAARGPRIREDTLHLFALAGGWPGALVAQAQFRHKTRKASFRAVFWATVLMNVAALGWLALGAPLPR